MCGSVCERALVSRSLPPKESLKAVTVRTDIHTEMNMQLLLLLALVGPFCAVTRASK